MRTRDVLRWHWSVRDMGELALITLAGLALGVLDQAAAGVERWIDRRSARVHVDGEVHDGT
jgi:hypothetical protein